MFLDFKCITTTALSQVRILMHLKTYIKFNIEFIFEQLMYVPALAKPSCSLFIWLQSKPVIIRVLVVFDILRNIREGENWINRMHFSLSQTRTFLLHNSKTVCKDLNHILPTMALIIFCCKRISKEASASYVTYTLSMSLVLPITHIW